MADPLSLFVPITQDAPTQAKAELIHAGFVAGVKKGLDASKIVHYARLTLIPNTSGVGTYGILLITTFDKGMDPYLQYFWKADPDITKAITGLADLMPNPPAPIKSYTEFENFINENNLNQAGDMYEAYTDTVEKIVGSGTSSAASDPV